MLWVLKKCFNKLGLLIIGIAGVFSVECLPIFGHFISGGILVDYSVQSFIIWSLSSFHVIDLREISFATVLNVLVGTIVLKNEVGAAEKESVHGAQGFELDFFLSDY